MSDTKLRPEDLTVEERAWCDRMAAALCSSGNYTAEGAIDEAVNFGLKKRRALFGQPKGESESCPNCGETTSRTHSRYAGPGPDKWTCQPAPPEPAAPEMPGRKGWSDDPSWIVDCAATELRRLAALSREGIRNTSEDWPETCASRLENLWRNLAQPVAVGMTEELEHVLSIAERDLRYKEECFDNSARTVHDERIERLRAAIAAVREQFGKRPKLEKVRGALSWLKMQYEPGSQGYTPNATVWKMTEAALAELDAAEGKGEGRG